ncbi:VCBS domain-containing protein [Maricaulis maris]|nr:VCBS domain-containing protein [Maricaulis maris]
MATKKSNNQARQSAANAAAPANPGIDIDGSGRGDLLFGTGRDDIIDGRGGNDLILGLGGDDVISGGGGHDFVLGGAGDDDISGDAGNDFLSGGSGNDVISGGRGRDFVLGGSGDDQISGGRGGDTLNGGDGNDVIDGGAGNDRVSGDAGDDFLSGGAGRDTLLGGDGDDILSGGAGRDTIIGGQGHDTLVYGGSVRDAQVTGDSNQAEVRGADGRDTLEGVEAIQFDDGTVYLDGRNNGPMVEDQAATISENDIAVIVNVLDGAFDFDGDAISLLSVDAGDFAGTVSFDAASGEVSLMPGATYDHLTEGESVEVTLTYTATDGTDTTTGIIAVTITGIDDEPLITAIDLGAQNEDDGFISVDLLATANGDVIGIEEIQSVASSNPDRTISWGLDPNNYDAVRLDLNQFTDLQAGETETVTITYVVGDNNGGLTTNTATFVVEGTNDLPTFVDFTLSLGESEPLWVNLLSGVQDVDSDTVIVTDVVASTNNPDRVVTANVNYVDGTVTFPYGQYEDLAEGETEILTISFNLDDGDGGVVARELSFTIVGENDAPNVVPIDMGTQSEDGGFISVDLMSTASDIDTNDVIGIEEIQSVASSNPDRTISWGLDPNNYDAVRLDLNQFTDLQAGETETVTITYVVGDNNGGLTTNTATFVVEGTNDLPTFVDFTLSLGESEPLWVNLLSGVQDVDSDTVIVTDVVASTNNPDRVVTANVNYVDGTVTFPYGQYEDLAEGETEILTISFNLDDGDGGVVARELSFTVIGQNDAPYIEPWNSSLEGTVDENDAVSLFSAGSIVYDDVDASDQHYGYINNVSLSGEAGNLNPGSLYGLLRLDDYASGGALGWTFNADSGLFDYLQEGESVTLTYDVEVSDGREGGQTTVSITIEGTNDLPVFNGYSFSLGESEPLWVNLLASVQDVDSDTLTVTDVVAMTNNPDRVVVANVNYADGTVTFPYGQYEDLAAGETETLTIRFNVDDGDGGVVPCELNFTVIGQNDAPYIEPWNSTLEGTVDENDAPVLTTGGTIVFDDVDASDQHYGYINNVTQTGTVGDFNIYDLFGLLRLDDYASGGALGWTFNADSGLFDYLQEGESITLTYDVAVSDGREDGQTTVSITIEGTNDLPTFIDFGHQIDESTSLWVNLLSGVQDVDSDAVTISDVVAYTDNPDRVVALDVNLAEGTVRFPYGQYEDLAEGESEILTISYTIDDGDGGVVPAEMHFTVIGSNDAPYIEPWNSTLEGTVDENDAPVLTTGGSIVFDDVDASDQHYGSINNVTQTGTVGDFNIYDLYGLLRLDDYASGGALGWTFNADSSLFDYLQEGESVTLTYDVEVTDGREGGQTTVSITIEGSNDLPSFVDFTISFGESEPLWVNLLASVQDVDSDTVVVTDVTAHTDNPDRVVVANVDYEAGTVSFPYGQYEDLAEGETETLTISFNLEDSDGGVLPREFNFTIIGQNDAPYFEPWNSSLDATADTGNAGQLEASGVIGIWDPDASDEHTGATLSVSLAGDVGGLTEADVLGLLSFDGSRPDASVDWSFASDSTLFAYLSTGENVTLTYEVEISDGHDSVTAPVTITITGQNDLPMVSADIAVATHEDAAPLLVDLFANASDPEGDDMAVTGVVVTTASGRTVDFSVDALTGEMVIDPAQFGDLDAGELETLTVSYGIGHADTVITGGADSIPTIGNAGRWFVVDLDSGQTVQEARGSGNSAEPFAVPANGVVFHFNGNNADYVIAATAYVDGVASVIDPAGFEISGYSGTLYEDGVWLNFADTISDAMISWTGTIETVDGPRQVSFTFDGLNFTDNQTGTSTLDSFSVEVSGPRTAAIAVIEVEGRDEGAAMEARVFSKGEVIDVAKVPVADTLTDGDAGSTDGLVTLSHEDALTVITAADVADFAFERVFDVTNFRGAVQFASLTEADDTAMEVDSVQPALGQADAFDLPGLDAFGLPQDDAALTMPLPEVPEGW